MQQGRGTARRGRVDGLWIALSFLLVYEMLRQQTVFGDGVWILHNGEADVVTSNVHLLYLPLLRALRWLLDPLGVSVFQITSHLSCVAMAVGIGLVHTAFRVLAFSRRDALLAATLVGFCPGIVFYASVIEWQALFFAFAGLSFVAAARMAVLPTAARAVQLGLSTGAAYLAHASGVILPLPLLLIVWAIAFRGRGNAGQLSLSRCIGLTVAAGLVHLIVVWGVPSLLRTLIPSITVSLEHARDEISVYAANRRWTRPGAVIDTVWNEWLFAFMPLSVVSLLGFAARRTRWMAAALAVSLVPYLTVSIFMLAGHDEHGAYPLPLAVLAAWITLRCCPRPVVLGCATLAAAISVGSVKLHDQPERSLAFAEGLQQVADAKPMALLIGDNVDLEARFVRLPEIPYLLITWYALADRPAVEAGLPLLDVQLDKWFAEGRRVFLTDRVDFVVQMPTFEAYASTLDEVILGHLRDKYELTPVAQGAFGGQELRRR